MVLVQSSNRFSYVDHARLSNATVNQILCQVTMIDDDLTVNGINTD